MSILRLAVLSMCLAFSCASECTSEDNVTMVTPNEMLWTLDTANWMRDNMDWLGMKTLKQICIPGSHNAGMSLLNGGTTLANPCNILTQSLPVRGQLELGARYFDVRPVIAKGRFLTGHYSRLPGGSWQGGNGQPMEDIVCDLNDFTRNHNELVIVSVSHSLNTDLGNTKFRSFNQVEWERLFQLLDMTENLFVNDGNVYLPGVTLGQFTNDGNNAAVLLIVNDSYTGVDLGFRLGRGYYYPNNINLYDRYSNTNKFSSMAGDQIKKMKNVSMNAYFLLSWTLSQGGKDAALCHMNLGKSIKHLAKDANNNLESTVFPEITEFAYPNVIFVDDINTPAVTQLALAINIKLHILYLNNHAIPHDT